LQAALAQGVFLGPARFSRRAEWNRSLEDLADYHLGTDASVTIAIYAGLERPAGMVNEINNRPRRGVKRHGRPLAGTLTCSVGG
jgi:hypothetical protein